MDSVFRDSTLKGPLWEEVSRKLAELGYHRSAKKCKEKFENVYKYHKRTKDGRTSKADGKTYRFFDQLEALQNLHSHQSLSPPKPQTPNPTSAAMPWGSNLSSAPNLQVQSTTINPTNAPQANANLTISTQAVHKHSINPYSNNLPSSFHRISSNIFSTSTSSSTASDEDSDQGSSKKKSKWKAFFRRLTKEVIEKQEQLQNKFLESIERCEKERMALEEDLRIQEMVQINKEHEILVQERSMAAAKDAAVIAFLRKISDLQPSTVQLRLQENPQLPPAPAPQPTIKPSLPPTLQQASPQSQLPTQTLNFDTPKKTNGGNNNVVISSSPPRWPKAEVQALINIRTNLDIKYQENGTKAPLWEDISAEMRKHGYNRSAKRCKEKWENINKYFKKVKESNKRRPEDSKTCPYFHQLDAIYKEKISKNENSSFGFPGYGVKLDSSVVPLMVRPEQQWPPPLQEMSHQGEAGMMEEDDEEDGDSEEEYEGNDFELVANKSVPITSAE